MRYIHFNRLAFPCALLSALLYLLSGCGTGSDSPARLEPQTPPAQAAGQFDVPSPSAMLVAGGDKAASAVTLFRKGSDYMASVHQHLEPQGDLGVYTPSWAGNWSGFSAVAYGGYRLNIAGAGMSSVVNLDWEAPPADNANIWIGLSDWIKDTWDWYQLPADGSLELSGAGLQQYTKIGSGDVLVAVAALGQDACSLHHVWLGSVFPAHTISGDIKSPGGTGIADVTVSFSGGLAPVQTDATGHFVRDGVYDGTYTATPGKPGCTFTPVYRNVVVDGNDPSGIDFATVPAAASGYVKLAGGAGIAGVTLSFTGGAADVVTDASGYWQAGPLADGTYTATPSKTGYVFTPASFEFTMAGANVVVPEFSGDCSSASGYCKDGGGAGLAGVTLSFTGGLGAVTTNASGYWQCDAIPDGTYTATPSKPGTDFTPASQEFTISGNDQVLGDFTGTMAASIDIVSLTTDKTTHSSAGTETPSQLTLVTDPAVAESYTWTGQGDFSSTSVANPTWKPNGTTKLGLVTLTVEVTLGAATNQATIDLYVTGESIKTSFSGRDGQTRPVGDPPGSGIMPDVSLAATQYLEPLFDGGDITAGTGMLSDYMAGRPILFDEWELWCGPCRAEFPALDDYGEAYRDYGFRFIAGSSDTSAGNQLTDIKAWFMGNAIDYCHDFHGNIYSATWAKLGADGYIPFNVLIDRDGMVRKVGGQANGADWAACIQEMSGAI